MTRFQQVLFIVNRTKPDAEKVAQELCGVAESLGVKSHIHTCYPIVEQDLGNADLCVVVGGDGTLLGVVEATSARALPVIGVNMGRLGFMASFSPQEAREELRKVLSHGAQARRLSLLRCDFPNLPVRYALNDLVIKAKGSRLIRIEIHCEEEPMNTYHADGIICATPTGSTAYNLSAGGPILHPSTRAFVVTPINPHTLSTRAIVLDDTHRLTLRAIGDPHEVQIAADGQTLFEGALPHPIQFSIASDRDFRLIQPEGYSHFSVLRSKLHWSGDAIFSTSDQSLNIGN